MPAGNSKKPVESAESTSMHADGRRQVSVSDGIWQKSDIAVENSLTKRKVDVGAALNSKPKGCRNRDHVDRLHLKMTGLILFRPLLSIEPAGEQGECGWEDRARDGRARDVAGMTLGRIGNTNAAILD